MRLRDGSARASRFGAGSFSSDQDHDANILTREEIKRGGARQRESGDPIEDGAAESGYSDSDADGENGFRERGRSLPVKWAGPQSSWRGSNPDTSRYARELKTILASLTKSHSQATPQRIVIAGVNMGLDASTVARGLATTCAASGFRALLVDTDLERPTVHRDFGVSNAVGLSNLLSSADSPHRLAQGTALPNLAVIAAGPRVSNYSSLLARQRIFHRLEPIARHFDYIIADAGTLPASLVGRVCADADNVIIAVKEHVSSIRDLEKMLRTLRAEAGPEPAVLMVE